MGRRVNCEKLGGNRQSAGDKLRIKRSSKACGKKKFTRVTSKSMSSSVKDVPDTPHTGVSSSTLTDRVRGQAAGNAPSPHASLRRRQSRSEGPSRAGDPRLSTRLESNFRRRSDPEQAFKETYLRKLQTRRPLAERIQAARAACREIQIYSVETLIEIWDAAEDLIAADSPMEARKAGFELLAASAGHSGFDDQERVKFFDIITASLDPGDAVFRLKALTKLTRNGHNTFPFESRLAVTLNIWLRIAFDAALSARAAVKGKTLTRAPGQPPVEEGVILLFGVLAQVNDGLSLLLRLVTHIATHSQETFQGDQLADLVDRTLWICRRTTNRADIENGVNLIEAVKEFSHIPESYFETYIETLCAISCAVETSGYETKQILLSLLKSEDGLRTVDSLLRILSEAPPDKSSNTVRGALAMVKYIVMRNGTDNHPIIGFEPLVDALSKVRPMVGSRLALDCLQIIGFILDDQAIVATILHNDWGALFFIIRRIALRLPLEEDNDAQSLHSDAQSSTHSLAFVTEAVTRQERLKEEALLDGNDVLHELIHIANALGSVWHSIDARNRFLTAQFYWYMNDSLDATALEHLLDYIVDLGVCFPPAEQWAVRFTNVLSMFLFDITKPSAIRCRILEMAKEIHKSAKNHSDQRDYTDMIRLLLDRMKEEESLLVINSLADFLGTCTAEIDDPVFRETIIFLQSMVAVKEETRSATSTDYRPSSGSESTNNNTATCLVRLFLRCLESSAEKTKMVHEALMTIASSQELPTSSRLTAMKLLTRIRCDSDSAVIIIDLPDSQSLASALGRLEASIIANGSEQPLLYRMSLVDESPSGRIGRSTSVNRSNPNSSRSGTRSVSGLDVAARATHPLWMYPEIKGLPEDPPKRPSPIVRIYTNGPREEPTLKLSIWLENMIGILQKGKDWEIQSYVLVHLPSQLSNPSLFAGALPSIKMLRNVVCEQLKNGSFIEPPSSTGLKRSDVALCLFHVLIVLLGYHDHFARSEEDDIVKTFLTGIDFRDRTAKCCIHALSVCCHELPLSIARSLNLILHKMSQIITQTHLAMDTLEFLGGLARLPDVYVNLAEDELRLVFGICIRYLHHSREQRQYSSNLAGIRTGHSSVRLSATSADIAVASDTERNSDAHKDLPQYVFALAYHVITIWFLSLRLQDRSKHVGWITKSLAAKDELGNEIMEEQSQVTLDMMHRTAYSDLGETKSNAMFTSADGDVIKRSWLVGMSIVTVETAVSTGLSQITKRQASGTTHAIYQQQTAPLPPHHVPAPTDYHSTFSSGSHPMNVFPNHVFLQLTSTIAPMPIPMQPLPLPEDDATRRAISTFDRNDTVDGHKVGFIYIGNNQTSEAEILANTMGSEAYYTCLRGLGTEILLKDAIFNTQGLDRQSDLDGQHTYAWRDRITEIIFHVTTLMPTDIEQDAQCVNKKRHIGNDFVNIIYNDSGLPFRFETFPSQFNYVNIIITPEASLLPRETVQATTQSRDSTAPDETHAAFPAKQQFFKVQTISAPSFPQISPAATPKLVSATALPGFVRQLALNASVFSLVWANREGGEHVSSWRNRLREIVKLRERFGGGGGGASAGAGAGAGGNNGRGGVGTGMGMGIGAPRNELYPEMGGAASGRGARGRLQLLGEGEGWRGTLAMRGVADEEGLVGGIDFSRWAT